MIFLMLYLSLGAFLGILGANKIKDLHSYLLALIVCALFWPMIVVASIFFRKTK